MFVKLDPIGGRCYNFSRSFGALTSNQELYKVLQILKRLVQIIS